MTWSLPNSNLLFIHIPKCGGTSIHKSMSEHGIILDRPKFSKQQLAVLRPGQKQTPPHIKVSEYIDVGLDIENYHVISQTRNPYTRLVSLFYFVKRQDKATLLGRRHLKADLSFYENRYKFFNKMTFETFVKTVLDPEQQQELIDKWVIEYTSQLVYGLTPQHAWIDGTDVRTFKMENYAEILVYIKKYADIEFGYRHRKWQRIPDYMGHYTQETLEIVYDYYKEDFVRFGYDSAS